MIKKNCLWLGYTQRRYRGVTRFGIKPNDRFSHMYIVGKTGVGKTTFLENLIKQDIRAGRSAIYIDPHGDSAQELLSQTPLPIKEKITYIDFSKTCSIGINPLRQCPEKYRTLLVSGLLDVFKKQWTGLSWGVKMEHLLRNALTTLVAQNDSDLSGLQKIFTDKAYLSSCLKNVTSQSVLHFWKKEWANYSPWSKTESYAPIANKIGAFLSNEVVAGFISKDRQQLSFREAIDGNKIIIFNLAKGKIGSDAANLLGGFLVTLITLAAFSRANVLEENRKPCFLYLDEFQNITPHSITDGLSELRKYKLGLILAHQYVDQMPIELRNSVLGEGTPRFLPYPPKAS